MTSSERDSALEALLRQVKEARGFRCDAYKESCLRRRLAVRMHACKVETFAQYADHLAEDAAEYDRLLDALTINVTKFYRNADTWNRLATTVVPELLGRGRRMLRCWSAGCASGEEPYTLAALLLDQARRTGTTAGPPAWIDATDFDIASLRRAGDGRYAMNAFEEMPDALTTRYFHGDPEHPETLVVSDELRRLVRFSRHDVTKDPPPNPPYDLILFRNVVIYFDRSTQEQVFARMADSLATGGAFILGKVETLFGTALESLQLEDVRERVYRRR